MVYDPVDRYVLLFGGEQGGSLYGDSWMFAHGKWTQLSPATSPSGRTACAMTYDAKDGYTLLFGGSTGTTILTETWSYS